MVDSPTLVASRLLSSSDLHYTHTHTHTQSASGGFT
uniref:Uncharacterized protein n=1 Tax=Arundo donax TaxID=35708 RepID=A0A0A9B829_ARUDO